MPFERSHQIDINCSAEELWPWIKQIGSGRAGWYSYDWIDNWGKQSIKRIDPNFQKLNEGDRVSAFIVSELLENEKLVLSMGEKARYSLLIHPRDNSCILEARIWVQGPKWLLAATLGVGHEIMQRKQLREIKKRAEKNS